MISAQEALANTKEKQEKDEIEVAKTNTVILEFLGKIVERLSKEGKTSHRCRVITPTYQKARTIQTSEQDTSSVYIHQLINSLEELGYAATYTQDHLNINWGKIRSRLGDEDKTIVEKKRLPVVYIVTNSDGELLANFSSLERANAFKKEGEGMWNESWCIESLPLDNPLDWLNKDKVRRAIS